MPSKIKTTPAPSRFLKVKRRLFPKFNMVTQQRSKEQAFSKTQSF